MSRKPHGPTDETKTQVKALAGFGVREDEIALYIGIDPKTLRKYYRNELDTGHIHANAAIARSLYSQATTGSTSAAIFWLKSRAGWRENIDLNLTSSDGSMSPPSIIEIVGVSAKNAKN
jgi:hypothetical protein